MSKRRKRKRNSDVNNPRQKSEKEDFSVIPDLAKDLPEEERKIVLAQMSYSGPLPHPFIIERYDQVVPGAAERILAAFEKQSAHRQELEKRVIEADILNERLGLGSAFLLTIFLIVVGTYITTTGYPYVGGIIFSTTIAAVVSITLFKRKQAKEEQSESTDK